MLRPLLVSFCLICIPALAQERDAEQFFESKIRPILANNCYQCHTGANSGGLRVDSREALLKGGKTGPSVIPGNPAESLLIQATSYSHARIKMPPADKLDATEIADLSKWVSDGAVWPKSDGALSPASSRYQISQQQRAFWSFQPVKDRPLRRRGWRRGNGIRWTRLFWRNWMRRS